MCGVIACGGLRACPREPDHARRDAEGCTAWLIGWYQVGLRRSAASRRAVCHLGSAGSAPSMIPTRLTVILGGKIVASSCIKASSGVRLNCRIAGSGVPLASASPRSATGFRGCAPANVPVSVLSTMHIDGKKLSLNTGAAHRFSQRFGHSHACLSHRVGCKRLAELPRLGGDALTEAIMNIDLADRRLLLDPLAALNSNSQSHSRR
jgi:hypothetical protein